ncbi:hypothetical protein EXU48_12790 [Occultella glacieicola]|uniref:Uncharacterized protein n=1 Tax=Occultella glacieicola TaxID=2518684 RepID=A0ABY2E1T1_9MICO|nr:hypothetical protein [Occultella glacieicola]TDE92441.1 hypothetical protein EXU48_12790 [Occultella glacieicola]
MTTVAEIERLKALVDRLLPLADRRLGDLITADDWNTVVGALLEVARAVVEDEGGEVGPHEHPDQVTLGWLHPQLRALIERGPLDDPVAVARVSALERGVTAAQLRLDTVALDVRGVRTVAGRVETSDLERESSITQLSRKVNVLGGAQEEISALRGTLDTLRGDLTRVATFADSFANVTPGEVLGAVRDVGHLTERLTTPTGALLDVAEIERRLTVLATTLVTEDELTAALENVRPDLPDGVLDGLLAQTRAAALEEVQTGTAELSDRLTAQITERLAGVEDIARETALEAAEQSQGPLRERITEAVRGELTGLVEEGDDAVRVDLADAVESTTRSLRQLIDEQSGLLSQRIAEQVEGSIERLRPELDAQVREVLARDLEQFGERFSGVERELGAIRENLRSVNVDVAALRERVGLDLADLGRTLRAEFQQGLRTETQRFAAQQTALTEQIRGELAIERLRIDRLGRLGDGGVIRPADPILRPVDPILRPTDPILRPTDRDEPTPPNA